MPTVMSSGPDAVGRPDAARDLFGHLLSVLRERQKISREAAGDCLDCSVSKISRIESGESRVKEDDLYRLLDLYAVVDLQQRFAMMQLANRLNTTQWWNDYKDVLAGWFCSYLVFESVAEHIRSYEVRFVPGLLQTKAYAEAVIRLRHTDEREVKRRVDVRMRRQRLLLERGEARSTPVLWAVVDEAALDPRFAGSDIMQEQLDFLIAMSARHDVTIQVLTSEAGPTAAAGNSFSTLRLSLKDLSDVVYLEQIDSALFLESAIESDPYELAWTRLSVAAKNPIETTALLQHAREVMRSSADQPMRHPIGL